MEIAEAPAVVLVVVVQLEYVLKIKWTVSSFVTWNWTANLASGYYMYTASTRAAPPFRLTLIPCVRTDTLKEPVRIL
jgi:hypothetical protein